MKLASRVFPAVAAVLILTVLVFFGLTRIVPLMRWLFSDAGYDVLAPLFRAYGAVGVEGHEDVIGALLIVTSFVVACALLLGASRLARRHE